MSGTTSASIVAETPSPIPRIGCQLTDDQGAIQLTSPQCVATFKFYDDLIKDKIVVINFMYVKCDGVCPGITANLAKLQKLLGSRLGRDIFMYSFTLKPEQDSPEVLRNYAKAYHAKKGWTFLTGTPEDMELLRRKLGFTDPDPKLDADKSNHIGNVRYGNEALQLWGSCPGLSKASWMAESISWVDRPKSGKGESR